MTTSSPWFYGLLGLVVITVIAWPAILLYYSTRRPATGRLEAPQDRWTAGGMFRGDPRAVSRRDEVPNHRDIPSASDLEPGDVLPPEPQELAARRRGHGAPAARRPQDADRG